MKIEITEVFGDKAVKIVISANEARKDGGVKRFLAEKGPSSRAHALAKGILASEEIHPLPPIEWEDEAAGIGTRSFPHLGDCLYLRYQTAFIEVAIE